MTLRILSQAAYSSGENPLGDSSLWFTLPLIKSLLRLEEDLHFYILVPNRCEDAWQSCIDDPRVTLLGLDASPRLHGGDFEFQPTTLYSTFDARRYDVDVLLLNQLELVAPFLQFFNRQMFHNISAISYVHWFDERRPSTPKNELHLPSLLASLGGALSSRHVGCNSAFGRNRVLARAERWFNREAREELARKMVILPPCVDAAEIVRGRPKRRANRNGVARILINHRLLRYTGVRQVLSESLPRLWKRRQDFRVLVTNPTRVRLPRALTETEWLQVSTFDRTDYIAALWEADIVVAPHRATHWSISTLEAIAAGCVPLMNRESFFPEMMDRMELPATLRQHVDARWLYYRHCFGRRLESIIDNLPAERRRARVLARHARGTFDWDRWAPQWLGLLRSAADDTPPMDMKVASMRRIVDLVREHGTLSKREILRRMKWAPKQRTLAWSSMRKALLAIAPDDASSPEAVFSIPDG